MRYGKNLAGLTLVEVIVAMAVLSILAAALSPLVVRYVQDARRTRSENDMRSIATAYIQYFSDTGVWPCNWSGTRTTQTTLTTQSCFYQPERAVANWNGPYLKDGYRRGDELSVALAPRAKTPGEGLLDGWGQPYTVMYQAPTNRIAGASAGAIIVVSSGPDGTLRTSRRRAVEGTPVGDDLIHVVTRKLN
jgi:prepilin-type N-terminal cleavage/methylation domain-containing protein